MSKAASQRKRVEDSPYTPAPRRRAKAPPPDVDFRNWAVFAPRLDGDARGHYGSGASFCIRRHRPKGRVHISCRHGRRQVQLLLGLHAITSPIRRTFRDEQYATELGAYAVALALAGKVFGAQFSARSAKGTGFDFYLAAPGTDGEAEDDDIFANHWALEVSGILEGGETEVRARVKQKKAQVARASKTLPVLVAVIEFSAPIAHFHTL